MSIQWQCKCGNPLQVPDGTPEGVVTCGKCYRSVSIPQPERPLDEEAQRYLQGRHRQDTRQLKKPLKCTYCGWLVWSAEARDCPKCLRKLDRPSVIGTIVSYAVLTILIAAGWHAYQTYFRTGAGIGLEAQAAAIVDRLRLEWKFPDEQGLVNLAPLFPNAIPKGKPVQAEVDLLEARALGSVDGVEKARMTYRVRLFLLDADKPEGDPARLVGRGEVRVEQRLKSDGQGKWLADGAFEVTDRKE